MMEHTVFPEVSRGFYLVLVKSGWRDGSFSSLFSLLDLNREYGWCSDGVVEPPPPRLWFVCYQCVRQSLLDNFSHLPKLSPFLLNRDLVTFYITQIYNKVIFFLQEQQEQLQHTTLTTVLGRQSSFKYLSLSLPSISIQALLCLS